MIKPVVGTFAAVYAGIILLQYAFFAIGLLRVESEKIKNVDDGKAKALDTIWALKID